MDSVVVFAIGTVSLGLLSVLFNFIFIACLNISAEKQVSSVCRNIPNNTTCILQTRILPRFTDCGVVW